MTRINDFEFSIAMKIAANRCLADDVNLFMGLDTAETVVDPHVEKRVVRRLKYDEWKNVRIVSAKTLKYALIVIVSAVSLFFATAMTIQPVRAAFFNAIITWYEDFIEVRYEDDVAQTEKTENDTNDTSFQISFPQYLPDGLTTTFETVNDFEYFCELSDGNIIINYIQTMDYENGVLIDSDVIEEEIVYLNDNQEANLFINENGDFTLVWKNKYMFVLKGTNISLDEIIKIAESIG